jgi:hypothetical protein
MWGTLRFSIATRFGPPALRKLSKETEEAEAVETA